MEGRPFPRLKKANRRHYQSDPPVEALESLFTFAREDSDHDLQQANLDTNHAEVSPLSTPKSVEIQSRPQRKVFVEVVASS